MCLSAHAVQQAPVTVCFCLTNAVYSISMHDTFANSLLTPATSDTVMSARPQVHIAAHCKVDEDHPHGAILLASAAGETGPGLLTADAIINRWGCQDAKPLSALLTVLSACNSGGS